MCHSPTALIFYTFVPKICLSKMFDNVWGFVSKSIPYLSRFTVKRITDPPKVGNG